MFLRIVFETPEDMYSYYAAPKGTCLTYPITPRELRDKKNLLGFWYVDIDILNKHYGGVLKALQTIQALPGVKSVDVLPIERDPRGLSEEHYYDLLSCVACYIETLTPSNF